MASTSTPSGSGSGQPGLPPVDLKPLLTKLWPVNNEVTADEIAEAISHFFTNQVTEAQTAALLMALHFTKLDFRADVLQKTAAVMLEAAEDIPVKELNEVLARRGRKEGAYNGGLCDIVGTGGDSHNTFNVSTTASILASSLLMVSKHGNRASTSKSGSADMLNSMKPRAPVLNAVKSGSLVKVYSVTNYSFLFAPVFHTGMRYVAPVRKQLPFRTIFNNLGPLANPVEDVLEARVIGVGRRDLGPAFAEALKAAGCRKALIVCGEEELDEISCAGGTLCWMLREKSPGGEVAIERFTITPEDFGATRHALSEVSPGKEAAENAEILRQILCGEFPDNDPLIDFIAINTAALFVVSGICEADTSDMGHGDDGKVILERGHAGQRWKEGFRRAKWAIKSGQAWKQWHAFVEVTNEIGS
ncbi:anthranilate phosphoribosyltransferase Trp4 [Metarhizium robertsii]|uniref:Anthranilate phosphoribosyltransferase n=2 Tax=Metarhizium robertsii TaxID=568076 RepID=E9EVS5_METRA|nr:anthranilate phosphoribosyltransferase [Metarhizium robertsii ARSEF 23]EFZ00347.1 anthranilate phosphoribosyltransferase [Metarhizium robertsii ARSEF 23]EXV02819.1 anthranilate phosphoribosyltransferase Trp4 [Metarhizium robertsii]